jgi:predicted transcriptional regulator of viral defense system
MNTAILPPKGHRPANEPSLDDKIPSSRPISPGLGPVELAILAQADRHQRSVLVFPDDAGLLDEVTGGRRQTEASVRALVRAGWLRRVRRGTFVVRTRAGTLDQGALALVGDITRHAHLVTGGVALARAGLTDQSFRTIIVATASLQRPWSWLGETVRYVKTREDALWGGRAYSGTGSTRIARPTRAVLDSLAHPRWGVSLSEVAKALYKGERDPKFLDQLADDTAHLGNALAARRVGFLVQRLFGREAARPFVPLRGRSKAIVPLAPATPSPNGAIDTTWRLRINVDLDLVLGDLVHA